MRKVGVICSDPDDSTDCFLGGEHDDDSIHQNDVQDVVSRENPTKKRGRGPNKGTSPYKWVRQRGRKWVSEFRDPIAKCTIWLGTFDSAEEAHQAHVARKLEFEIERTIWKSKSTSASDRNIESANSADCFSGGEHDEESIHQNDVQDVVRENPVKKRGRGPNKGTSPYTCVRQRGRKWVSEFRDPIAKCTIWLGTFESAEEAHQAHVAKKLEFERTKWKSTSVSDGNSESTDFAASSSTLVLESKCLISATDCSSSDAVADEERLPLKQILQLSVEGTLMEIGSHIIDQNGYLLGEFSRLDNDLRILDTEGEWEE